MLDSFHNASLVIGSLNLAIFASIPVRSIPKLGEVLVTVRHNIGPEEPEHLEIYAVHDTWRVI
jgi:hypothetical protein